MGDRKKASRKRAVGTREHIVAYLADTRELFDQAGMASTRLAAAVGYPGSSVAFAQLLSGMERSGLVERDVRGKRTYRIRLGPAAAAADGSAAADGPAGAGRSAGASGGSALGVGPAADGFDYDELARRLLAQVVRRLAGSDPARLEDELASAWTEHVRLAEENARLREQLRAAERSLALARESLRRLPAAADLDRDEVLLLQRLLAAPGDAADLADARSAGA